MYGYAYGAAKSDVWHKWDTYSMGYPGFQGWAAYVAPKMIHYGLFFEVGGRGVNFEGGFHQIGPE